MMFMTFVKERFIGFPLVRKRGATVTVVLLDFLFDAGVVGVCGHRQSEVHEGCQRFERSTLLTSV